MGSGESFIGKYFLLMPPLVRVVAYLLIVLVYVHNQLQPTSIQGAMYIKNCGASHRLSPCSSIPVTRAGLSERKLLRGPTSSNAPT